MMPKKSENRVLPLFYKELVPLNSNVHATSRARTTNKASWLVKQHAVPLMTDEFAKAQRCQSACKRDPFWDVIGVQ